MGSQLGAGKHTTQGGTSPHTPIVCVVRGVNERFGNQIKSASEPGYVSYAQIPDQPHDEKSEIFHCRLKSWRQMPPRRSQRTAKLTAKVPKIRGFSKTVVQILYGVINPRF